MVRSSKMLLKWEICPGRPCLLPAHERGVPPQFFQECSLTRFDLAILHLDSPLVGFENFKVSMCGNSSKGSQQQRIVAVNLNWKGHVYSVEMSVHPEGLQLAWLAIISDWKLENLQIGPGVTLGSLTTYGLSTVSLVSSPQPSEHPLGNTNNGHQTSRKMAASPEIWIVWNLIVHTCPHPKAGNPRRLISSSRVCTCAVNLANKSNLPFQASSPLLDLNLRASLNFQNEPMT